MQKLQLSSENDEQQEDEELRCPKCKYFFSSITKPYILSCNHNICMKCIDSLIKENKNICPICNSIFNKDDRDFFQVNYGFLNLVIKILKTKIIFCLKCNKVFYWEDHHNNCDQSFFDETFHVFNEIKTTCEEGYKLIHFLSEKKNILINCKIDVFNNIKNITSKINEKYKNKTQNEINTMFNITNNNSIDFTKTKNDIKNYLTFFLEFPNLFDTHKINEVLNNGNNLSIIAKKNISHKKSSENNNKNPPKIKRHFNGIVKNIIPNYGNLSTSVNFNDFKSKIKKIEKIKEEEDDTIIKFSDDEDYSNDNNRYSSVHRINKNNKQININKYITKNNQRTTEIICKKIPISIKNHVKNNGRSGISNFAKRKKKFDINDLIDDLPQETQVINQIFVGLKDVKVVSLQQKINKTIMEKKHHNHNKSISPKKSNNKINSIKKINKCFDNINKNNSIISNSKALNPTSFYLKKYDKSACFSDNKILNNNKLNDKDAELNFSPLKLNKFTSQRNYKKEEIDLKIKKIPRNISENSRNIKNLNTNKILQNYNKISDIISNLNNYNDLINFLYEYILQKITSNISLLNNLIYDNYTTLLNDLSYDFHQTNRRFLISYYDNSKSIILYDTFYSKMYKKDFIHILTEYPSFNRSISMEYDDNNLIFISGGIEISNYNTSNMFIIINWEKEKIEYQYSMPKRKAFHTTIFFDKKLFLIGGMTCEQKVTNECLIFNYQEKKWYNFQNLNQARANCSICVYNNSFLYVFRGRNDIEVINTIEFISLNGNFFENKWNLFIPNDFGFIWFSCENSMCITIDKNKILICGGENKEGKLIKECILFEPESKNVYRGLDLNMNSCFKTQGCYYKGNIYTIDWKNQSHDDKHGIHIFDEKENNWKFFI